jgi:hypothetical protein
MDATSIELPAPLIYAIDAELGRDDSDAFALDRYEGSLWRHFARALCGPRGDPGAPPLPPSWPDDIHAKHLRPLNTTER